MNLEPKTSSKEFSAQFAAWLEQHKQAMFKLELGLAGTSR